jgi:hypothetical protein
MMQNAVLARDNMKKRKFPGNPMCSFFDHNEDRNHLFFTCTSAKVFGSISGSILGANITVLILFANVLSGSILSHPGIKK